MSQFAARPAVYRMFDEQGRLLYIGCTSTPIGVRLAGHRSDKPWFTEISLVTIEHFDASDKARSAEAAAIRAEAPKYNRNGLTLPEPKPLAAAA